MSFEREPETARAEEMSAARPGPWYASGLRFECTGCGACCTGGEGYVWVDLPDIRRLARHRSLSVDDFGRRFLRRVGQRYALLERAASGDCVFLRDRVCTVYAARPRQCATFPFWPSHLRSPEAWAAAGRACEGIRDDAPIVERAAIETLCPSDVAGPQNGAREHV